MLPGNIHLSQSSHRHGSIMVMAALSQVVIVNQHLFFVELPR
jgi:hypothetical protein